MDIPKPKEKTHDAYLFVWNPKLWNWETLEDNIEQVEKTGKTKERWSCGNTKSIQAGDRIFLVKLGTEPKGIIAAGFATTTPLREKHWAGENREALYIDIDFEVLLNPDKEPILSLDILKTGNLSKQYSWAPRASGIKILPNIVEELEAVWFDFLRTHKVRHNPFLPSASGKKTFAEGAANQVLQTRYERNPFARKVCIEHYGYSCSVCSFNFEKYYGQIGKDFIHVHHLTQVAKVGKEYEIDPMKDLRPVCPNCHAMLHRQNQLLSIEELKILINENMDKI
ncbi:MAG: HNH endonuclease [Ignavibacteriaceae bacterium]|jgi:5-methylcytosine-specific restriction protein A|nr:HNH endonuclease [Ignavibacteriaceae bacterium]